MCEFCGNDKDIIFPFELNKCERCEGEPPLVVGGLSAARSSPTPSWKDWKFPVPRRLARVLSQDRREGEGGEEEQEEEKGQKEEEDRDEGGKRKTGSSLSLEMKGEVEEQREEEREECGEEVEGHETDEPQKETIVKLFRSFTPAKLIHAFSTEKKDTDKEMEGEGEAGKEKEDGRIEGTGEKGEEKKKEKRNLLKKLASRGFSRSLSEQRDDKLLSKQGASAHDETTERKGDDKIKVGGGLSTQSSDAKIDETLEGELETAVGNYLDAQGKPELKDETKSHSVKLMKPGKFFGLFTNIRRAEEKVVEHVGKEEEPEEGKGVEEAEVRWRSRKTRKARRVSKGRKRKERGGGGGKAGEEEAETVEGRDELPVLVPSESTQRDSE